MATKDYFNGKSWADIVSDDDLDSISSPQKELLDANNTFSKSELDALSSEHDMDDEKQASPDKEISLEKANEKFKEEPAEKIVESITENTMNKDNEQHIESIDPHGNEESLTTEKGSVTPTEEKALEGKEHQSTAETDQATEHEAEALVQKVTETSAKENKSEPVNPVVTDESMQKEKPVELENSVVTDDNPVKETGENKNIQGDIHQENSETEANTKAKEEQVETPQRSEPQPKTSTTSWADLMDASDDDSDESFMKEHPLIAVECQTLDTEETPHDNKVAWSDFVHSHEQQASPAVEAQPVVSVEETETVESVSGWNAFVNVNQEHDQKPVEKEEKTSTEENPASDNWESEIFKSKWATVHPPSTTQTSDNNSGWGQTVAASDDSKKADNGWGQAFTASEGNTTASSGWNDFTHSSQDESASNWKGEQQHESSGPHYRNRPTIARDALLKLKNFTTSTTKGWEKKVQPESKPVHTEKLADVLNVDGSAQSKWAPQPQDRRESHNDWSMAVSTVEEPKIDDTASTTQKTENSNNGWGSIDSWSNNDPNANTTKMDDNVSSWASNDMNAVKAEESEEKDSAVNAWNMMASQLAEEASELEKRISSKKRNDDLPELTDEQRALAVNAWNTVKIPPVEPVPQQPEQQTTQDDTWDASAWPSSDSLADQWKTMNATEEQPDVAKNQPEDNAAWNQTSWDASATGWSTEQPSSNDNKQPAWDDNGKQESQWGAQQESSTSVESATWNSTPAIGNGVAASKSSSWKDLLPVADDDNTSGWKSFAEVSDNTATVNTLDTPAVQKQQQQPQTDLNWSPSSTVNPTASQHPTSIDMPTIRLSDFLASEPQQPPKSIDIPPVRLSDIISGTVNSVDRPTSSSLPSSSTPLPTNEIKLSLADLSNQDRTMIMNLVDTTEVKPREEITIRLSNIISPRDDSNSSFNFVYNGMSFDRQVPKEITMRLSDLLSGRF